MDGPRRTHLLEVLLTRRPVLAQEWHRALCRIEPSLQQQSHEWFIPLVECFLTQLLRELPELGMVQALGAEIAQLCRKPAGLIRSQEVLAQHLNAILTTTDLALLHLPLIRLYGEMAAGFYARLQAEAEQEEYTYLLSITYEQRTPLNAVIGFARLLLKRLPGPLTEEQQQILTTIYQSATRVDRLLNDFRDLARLKMGQVELEPEVFEVEERARVILKSVQSPTTSAHPYFSLPPGQVVELVCVEELGTMLADPWRVQQAVLYLLRDLALRFTSTGTIRLTVRRERWHEAEVVAFEIRSPDAVPFQVSSSQLLLEQEVLLALTRLMGGTFTAEGSQEIGSIFTLYLPAQAARSLLSPPKPG